jgi:FkbM family methyltransferase
MNLLNIPILKRLYPSIIRRYLMLIGKYQINIKINNLIFEIDIRESIERKTYFISEYEKKRMDQLHLLSKKINSEILIDIGAHIGFYSILSSHRFEQLYSFEPNERNFKVLKKNIDKNKLKNIKISNFGLGEKEEVLIGNSNTKGELFQTSGFAINKDNKKGESVILKKGDDVLQFKNKTLTIKIDVEGFEFFVLKGLKNNLINNSCVLQIEIWEKNNDEVHSFLNSLGYRMISSIDGDTYFSNKIFD